MLTNYFSPSHYLSSLHIERSSHEAVNRGLGCTNYMFHFRDNHVRFADNKYSYKNDFAGPLVLTLRWNFQGQPSFSAAAGVASIYREKKKS